MLADQFLFLTENENLDTKVKKMEQKFASLQIVKIIEKLGNEKVRILQNFSFIICLFLLHLFHYYSISASEPGP